MSPANFDLIFSKIEHLMPEPKQIHEPRRLLKREKLLATLRFLTSGEGLQAVGLAFSISEQALSVFIPEVCGYIWSAFKDEAFPKLTRERFSEIAQGLYFLNSLTVSITENHSFLGFASAAKLPLCVGCLDGMHIKVTNFPNAGSTFWCYKGHFSVNLMAICDSRRRFIYANVGSPGGMNDASIFQNCAFGRALYSNQLDLPPPECLPGNIAESFIHQTDQ